MFLPFVHLFCNNFIEPPNGAAWEFKSKSRNFETDQKKNYEGFWKPGGDVVANEWTKIAFWRLSWTREWIWSVFSVDILFWRPPNSKPKQVTNFNESLFFSCVWFYCSLSWILGFSRFEHLNTQRCHWKCQNSCVQEGRVARIWRLAVWFSGLTGDCA